MTSATPSKRRLISRARHACQRCRSQKLRCDNMRPCSGCSRLSIECKEISAKAAAYVKQASQSSPQYDRSTHHQKASGINQPDFQAPAISSGSAEILADVDSPMIYSQRPSTFEAVDQVFRQRHESAGLLHAADAIPGGTQGMTPGKAHVLSSDILGMDLPPAHVVNFLLDTYLTSVHWFMSVTHEPSIRADAHFVLTTGTVEDHRKLFPTLLLVIIAMGARYVAPEAAREACPDHDLTKLEPIWIKCVENKLLDAFEEGGLEAVQIAIILKSYYLYGNRPKRSIGILGAGIKVALSMKLHLESTWTTTNIIEINVRRRVWWSLYVADLWAATIYGIPCNIHDDDWDVSLPENIDDASALCPGYGTTEICDGKNYGQTTLFTYQRFKFTLYKLAFSIINTVYSHKKTTLEATIKRIRHLDERLKAWEAQIPPELLLKSVGSPESHSHETTKLFQRLALMLQLSHDNFRLLLHRPLLTMNRISVKTNYVSSPGHQDLSKTIDDTIKKSKYACWEAAMRTSQISSYGSILGSMRYCFGANYTMIQAFTAAVALGLFALSDPISRQAYEAKSAISRILGFPKVFGYRAAIFDQTTAILEELLRLILHEEMKALVGSTDTSEATIVNQRRTVTSRDQQERRISHAVSITESASPLTYQNTVEPSPNASVNDMTYGNFSDALLSLQDAFRDPRPMTELPSYHTTGHDLPGSNDLRQDAWMGVTNNPFGTESQGWIWDTWQAQDPSFSHFDLG